MLFSKNIEKVFFEEKPNIIHVRSRVPSWTAGNVAKKMNIPLVSTIHGSYVANSIIKRFYNSASINADKIIAISNYIKDNILKYNSYVFILLFCFSSSSIIIEWPSSPLF